MSAMTPAPAYALLADGSTILIRPAGLADFEAVKAMHEAMSPDNLYRRFFSIGALVAEREASRSAGRQRRAVPPCSRLSGDEVVGCASYESAPGGHAEIAFAVADRMHHKGIATLLLEHLVSHARDDGIQGVRRRNARREHRDAAGIRRRRAPSPEAMRRRGDGGDDSDTP